MIIKKIKVKATKEIKSNVRYSETLTAILFDFISNKREAWANEPDRITKIIKVFHIVISVNINRCHITAKVSKKPIAEIVIPIIEKTKYLCLSYKAPQQSAVRL